MTPFQAAIGYLGTLLVATSFVGILVRRRYRQWYAFALYLCAVSVFNILVALWPARFYTMGFWMVQENVLNLLRFATALELALRTFRWFPSARRTLSVAVLAVLLVTLVRVLAIPTQLDYERLLSEVNPHILDGSVWLFTIIASLILWYRLPVHAFHKHVVLTYVPYLLLFASTLTSLRSFGWDRTVLIYANQIGYVLLVGFWCYIVWRRDPRRASARGEPNPGPTSPTLSTVSTAA